MADMAAIPRDRPARERVGHRAGRRNRTELSAIPGLGWRKLSALVGRTSRSGCIFRRGAPGTGGWSVGAFRRSQDFELFGRELGAQLGDRVLQLGGRSRAGRDVISQPFLEGEGIGLAGRCHIGALGLGLTWAGATSATGTTIMPWRRKHRLQCAGIVAPGIELLAAHADAGLKRGKPGSEPDLRRWTHAMRAEAFRTVPSRPVRPTTLIR